MRGDEPALAALDDAPLRGEAPEGRLRGDVLQEGGRQELRLQAEADVAEAVAPLDGERTPAARLDAGERPDEMRHRRPVLAALRIGPGVVGDLRDDLRWCGRAEVEPQPDGAHEMEREVAEPGRAEVAPLAPRAGMVGAGRVRTWRGGAQPERPVERRGNGVLPQRPGEVGGARLMAARREEPDAAHLADEAAPQGGDGLAVALPGGDLRAHLRDGPLLGGEARDAAAVGERMAEGLLAVDVEPAPQRLQDVLGMRVVGGGDVHGVERRPLLLEHLEGVAVDARVGAEALRLGEVVRVDVAERRDVEAGMAAQTVQVGARHVARPDRGVGEEFVRPAKLHHGGEAHGGHGRRRGRRAQERASCRQGLLVE